MSARWTQNGSQFRLTNGPLEAMLDCLHPATGLTRLSCHGRPLPGAQLLGVQLQDWEPRADLLLDCYVRQGDLIAVYRATASRPFVVEVYWRAATLWTGAGEIPIVDLLVSVQTDLLDSHPELAVRSDVAGQSLACDFQASDGPPSNGSAAATAAGTSLARLVHWADECTSYLEMAHPDDAVHIHSAAFDAACGRESETGPTAFRWSTDFLEKGVIRRVRLRGAIVPREQERDAAEAVWRDLLARPLPLTT